MRFAASFNEWIDGVIKYSKGVCDEFSEAYAKNPAEALDNCDNAFENAARLELAMGIKRSLEEAAEKGVFESERIAYLKNYHLRNLLIAAAWPSHSTSVTSNFYHQCKTAAFAELLKDWPVETNEN